MFSAPMTTLAVDRRRRILEKVAADQTVHIAELATELGVSEMTIRRDVGRLEREGFLRRTYGGATAHMTRPAELQFNARVLQSAPSKRVIGMRAAELLRDTGTLFVGIGTTTEQFAMFLAARPGRTVVTGSLPVAAQLSGRSAHVVVLGGSVLSEDLACIGPVAAETVARYRVEVAVLGAAGLSAEHGLSELDDRVADVYRRMVAGAEHVVVVADGSKIGETAMATVVPSREVGTLVTDPSAPADELRALEAQGVRVVLATTR